MLKSKSDTFMLHNGMAVPCIGYGTYLTPDDETCKAVQEAIRVGYRLIDTAAFYGNEKGVGQAVRECGVPREELLITSKVWNADRGYEQTLAAFEKTMENLGLDYLDLYLIHWPANRKQFGDRAEEINAQTWRAMEELYRAGRIKAIGLSNFLPHHIEELGKTATVKPMVNQLEIHPGWLQKETVDYCQSHDIVVEAWSPLGRRAAFDNPFLGSLAEKYGKSAAQICLRWEIQHGVLPIPKTVNPARMEANLDIFDFEIEQADMEQIDAMPNIRERSNNPDEIDY